MRAIKTIEKQRGFLTLITVVLIVIVGFIGVALAYIYYGSAFATINLQSATAALYLAESGLEDGSHELLSSTLANRSACSGLSLTNPSIGSGAYTLTGAGAFYTSSPTTLNGALTASATSIPVVSTSHYQASGRIMIDKEMINYASVDATHFLGVSRGMDGTLAASHTSGTLIGQYQCNLTAQGGVPSLTPPANNVGGKSNLTEAIQLEDGFAAGNTLAGSNWNIAHWNYPTEKTWTQQTPAIASPQNLSSVSMVSNVDVWVVGTNATLLHYSGSTWTKINSGVTASDDLLSVCAISSVEAWASASQGRVYKWSGGASWTNVSSPGNQLNGISMVDSNGSGTANSGWVVGTKKTAFQYNGTTWSTKNTGITVDLSSVSTLSSTDAWAAGNSGSIFHWTGGASWTAVSTPSATPTLNGISMIKSGSSDIGWAVGTGSAAWFYNGTAWTSSNAGLAGGLTLNSVSTVSANEAWLCDSSGHIYEWNGSTWTLIFTSTKALTAIEILHPNTQPFSAWDENFS